MTLEAILTLGLAVMALALKPGPGMAMIMSRTISQGMGACFTFMLGYLNVTFIYLLIVFTGFHFAEMDMVFITILVKSLAAVYLIWTGFKGLQSLSESLAIQDVEGEGFLDNFFAAVMLTASNPLVIVFYAGILPTLLNVNTMTVHDMSVIIMVVLAVELIIPVLYCIPLAMFRSKFPPSFLRGLKLFSSITIILVGLYIGYTAIPAQDLLSVF